MTSLLPVRSSSQLSSFLLLLRPLPSIVPSLYSISPHQTAFHRQPLSLPHHTLRILSYIQSLRPKLIKHPETSPFPRCESYLHPPISLPTSFSQKTPPFFPTAIVVQRQYNYRVADPVSKFIQSFGCISHVTRNPKEIIGRSGRELSRIKIRNGLRSTSDITDELQDSKFLKKRRGSGIMTPFPLDTVRLQGYTGSGTSYRSEPVFPAGCYMPFTCTSATDIRREWSILKSEINS